MKTFSLILSLAACLAVNNLHSAETDLVDFVRQIKPILADRCIECHNSGLLLGEFNLQNRALAMKKRKLGPVIVPMQPEKSMIYLTLTLPPKEKKAMPATGHRIPKDEIETIRRWIQEGALWPEGKDGAITPRGKKP